MEIFKEFLAEIEDPKHRAIMEEVLLWVGKRFPKLVPRVAWNQPMFTNDGTFIIAFSVSKNHMAISPEKAGVEHFTEQITKAGLEYSNSKMLFRIKWDKPIDYPLLEKIIEFNIADKAGHKAFWRKPAKD